MQNMKKSLNPPTNSSTKIDDNFEIVPFSEVAVALEKFIKSQTDADFLLEMVHRLDPNITLREAILKMEALRRLENGE